MGYRPDLMRVLVSSLALLALLATGCDRRIEPYDPDEEVAAPDLSRIFPEGAERSDELAAAPAEPPPPPGGRRGADPVDVAAPSIRGTLEVPPELAGSVPSGGVLFIVARAPSGGPPVAVKRIAAPRFPLDFEIGPGDRMIQTVPFAGPLLLSARVDADGNATSRQPGDLQGVAAGPVDPGATNVTIRLDQQL
jgi:cytochrome c-type biogenesis protein CcmH